MNAGIPLHRVKCCALIVQLYYILTFSSPEMSKITVLIQFSRCRFGVFDFSNEDGKPK